MTNQTKKQPSIEDESLTIVDFHVGKLVYYTDNLVIQSAIDDLIDMLKRKFG